PRNFSELIGEKSATAGARSKKPGAIESSLPKTADKREGSKKAILESVSARPIAPLGLWKMRTLVKDPRFAEAGASQVVRKLVPVRLSGSGTDDIIVLESSHRQMQIVTAAGGGRAQRTGVAQFPTVVSLEAETALVAAVPMRYNRDAISDLVILREGSPVPAILTATATNTFVVDTTDDSGGGACDGTAPCSLRRAIELANQLPGADVINFNIGGGGLQTIMLNAELPPIVESVTIDGTSQPGYGGMPLIEISGANLSGAADGLRIEASNCAVYGLVINEMPSATVEDENGNQSQVGGNGIAIVSTNFHPDVGDNHISGNFLGTDPSGNFDKGNAATGLNIFDSDRNHIDSNLMSGNGSQEKNGAGLSITGGNNNAVVNNIIGLNFGGNVKLGNSLGIFLTGKENIIGGDVAGEGNTISGNGEGADTDPNGRCFGRGIDIPPLFDTETGELLTVGNQIKGNRIGTDPSGSFGLGNCDTGIVTGPVTTTVIGSIAPAGRNLISDNGEDAIWCVDLDSSVSGGYGVIIGNDIGTDITGTQPIPNDQRNGCFGFCLITDTVWLSPDETQFIIVGSPGGMIAGGECTGQCNLISGNYSQSLGGGGILRTGLGLVGMFNNYVGTTRNGALPLPNQSGVVSIFGTFTDIGGVATDENGAPVPLGNLISGNHCTGVAVSDTFNNSIPGQFNIRNNRIGTNALGNAAVPNSGEEICGAGISIGLHVSQAQVGGPDIFDRNIISGNGGDGIRAQNFSPATKILNNYIGVGADGGALGNGRNGISVASAPGMQIGGTGAGEGNVIKHNGLAGVSIEKFPSTSIEAVTVVGNMIAENGGLGIDLSNLTTFQQNPDGVTPNDCLDGDIGANHLQNHPNLDAPTFNPDGTVTVEGRLLSEPGMDYTIDFYASIATDPTGYGEGEMHIGAINVRTAGTGFVAYSFTSTVFVPSSRKITATATGPDGSTSEFSCAAGETCAGNAQNRALRPTSGACIEPIVVNVTSDEPDGDIADGRCDVDTSTPALECSLRAAIEEANARPGYDVINFQIPGSGVQTISPSIQLPPITEELYIDGPTQPGYSGSPVIEIRGDAGSGFAGLIVQTSDATIVGLTINRF
ncbi:MAG TPA: CSLREA domain-containing protein, partial [Chthoniobacterales bacterium]|nr:CSLREA domain-containing protein [Chthoniobacterales bacterium]